MASSTQHLNFSDDEEEVVQSEVFDVTDRTEEVPDTLSQSMMVVTGINKTSEQGKLSQADRKSIQNDVKQAITKFMTTNATALSTLREEVDLIVATTGKSSTDKNPTKKIAGKPVQMIKVSDINKVFYKTYLENYKKDSISMKDLQHFLHASAFTGNYFDRSVENYKAMNLSDLEISILSKLKSNNSPLNIVKSDKVILSKIIAPVVTFSFNGQEFSIKDPDLWEKLDENNCLIKSTDDTSSRLIPDVLVEEMKNRLGKKPVGANRKITKKSFEEYIVEVSDTASCLYRAISQDNVPLLDFFNIPYVKASSGNFYSKTSLIKAGFVARMDPLTKKFDAETDAVLLSYFSDYKPGKAQLDTLVSRCTFHKF